MRKISSLVAAVAIVVSLPAAPAFATGGEGESWPAFTESSACGARAVVTPHAGFSGWLSKKSILRGPFAAMFGRTVSQVFSDLAAWTVPGSSERLSVHERMIPALEAAAADVQERLDAGDEYRIVRSKTYAVAARTLIGKTRVSRHTFGLAIDFNAHRNPYRGDNRLVTDMPSWWVSAFEDAGFCWGGDWFGAKDAMHYSWQGPAFTAGAELPMAYPPLTDAVPIERRAATVRVVPRPLPATFATVLADVTNNGAVDVNTLAFRGHDVVVDTAMAARRYNACSLRRTVAADVPVESSAVRSVGFGDWDGRGGQDLWFVSDAGGRLRLTVRWSFGDFAAETEVVTGVPTPGTGAWISTADADRDGSLDLFVIEDGRLGVWAVDAATGATRVVVSATLPDELTGTWMIGDRDLDELPDLWALEGDTLRIATAAGGYATVSETTTLEEAPATIVDAAAADYDGDGRTDLVVYDGGAVAVWLGNTLLPDGKPLDVWFAVDEPECDELEWPWDEQPLRFGTASWMSKGAVAWFERNGFPAACDPTDERAECPPRLLTGGEFAAFLAWSADLDPGPGEGVIAAARALISAGIDSPCRLGDDACWERPMSRAEVASRFGRFLAARSGRAPVPHRWVPGTAPYPLDDPPTRH